MNNFKHFVPADLQAKMLSLVELSQDLVNKTGETIISSEDVEPIEGNYVSGWNPHQDGGFRASALISSDEGYTVCESHKAESDRMYFECLRQFCQENDIDYDASNNGTVVSDGVYDDEETREQFYDYQQEWNSDGGNEALLAFECFCNVGNDDSGFCQRCPDNVVTIRLSVNFKDAPYYREKYATDLYQVVYEIDEFMATDNEAIISAVVINREA